MAKARALRKRYISFTMCGDAQDPESLKRSLYAEALRFFGEYGLAEVALKLVGYSAERKEGIIRCERGKAETVLGFLALLDSLDGRPARIIAQKTSGTIKGLGQQ